MDELNDLSTKNAETTFNNTPNNTELSDELSAAEVYINKPDTQYARNKRIKRAIIVTGTSLLVVSGAVTAGSYISNGFVLDPPEVSDVSVLPDETLDTLHYSFKIENVKKYKVSFYLKQGKEIKGDILDVSISDVYEGDITELGYNQTYNYYIEFTNRVDYKKVLSSGTFTTAEGE